MNERIKSLMPVPARRQGQQMTYDGYDKAHCHIYFVEQMEEFAQLIVQECRDMISRTQGVDMIVKHFGVEE